MWTHHFSWRYILLGEVKSPKLENQPDEVGSGFIGSGSLINPDCRNTKNWYSEIRILFGPCLMSHNRPLKEPGPRTHQFQNTSACLLLCHRTSNKYLNRFLASEYPALLAIFLSSLVEEAYPLPRLQRRDVKGNTHKEVGLWQQHDTWIQTVTNTTCIRPTFFSLFK